jgi:hypothetical protein
LGEPEAADRRREVSRSGTPLPEGLLEQYKLAVEMADRVSARRAAANGFFLTVQSALVALLSVPSIERRWIAAAGVVFAATWWLLLRSYRQLNAAKWSSIAALESRLPAQPFTDEWTELKRDPIKRWRPRYAELGFVERIVPGVFAALFIVILISG